MVTEEEAKKKWCPMVRCAGIDDDDEAVRGAGNCDVLSRNPEDCRCIASDCMAWRWSGPQEYERPIQNEKPGGDGWEENGFCEYANGREKKWKRPIPRTGFCGVGGTPYEK